MHKREKKRIVLQRRLKGNNLGGRPKISSLKESLVIRLRNEGFRIDQSELKLELLYQQLEE